MQRCRRLATVTFLAALLSTVALSSASEPAAYATAEEVQPLEVGTVVPSVAVLKVTGEAVDLATIVAENGALLVFYRGGWCPYCNTQLGGLRKVEGELAQLGFPVVAISPDAPENMVASLKETDLGFDLYSDASMQASRAFGIAFELPASEISRYKGFGIDLEKASGQPHHLLPVPSVFLVEAGGTIRWAYSNPDYKTRPANEALLEAARALSAKE